MLDLLREPWPWYVAGPLLGLTVPLLLLLGNRLFGVSANLRHICAACMPASTDFFRYDWKGAGGWNLALAFGFVVGGFIAATWLAGSGPVAISAQTQADLIALGVRDFSGLVPADLLSVGALRTLPGAVAVVLGGFLVGFGAGYAGGCTSGHGLTGLATLQLPSLIAVCAFFVGGMAATYVLLPLLF
ncbi:MAG TPA: YeeE/YedE thiosulfate transporter family protein [Planctomycetaceae bacterium]|nr:YeeE/YedE thiosulfate transporter family protein [Planctomycetaceae bacterium]